MTTALRAARRRVYAVSHAAGVFNAVAGSSWRRSRLMILCYHGVSLRDEHLWRPGLYVRPSFLRHRLALLRDGGYAVLPLGKAFQLLQQGGLPSRSIVLTFDDGTYDFAAVAWPILREFGYPATVYWSTYYALRDLPVFSVAYSYASWKAGRTEGLSPELDALSGAAKQEVLRESCQKWGVDYEALFERDRLLTIMKPHEVRELATEGCDVQLHTHTHRMPLEEKAFRREIVRNREVIVHATSSQPVHFCYTSGRFRRRFLPWLTAEGVLTATTTEPGLVARNSEHLLAPRLVDHEGLSDAEFLAWTSGVAEVLPRRRYWNDPDMRRLNAHTAG